MDKIADAAANELIAKYGILGIVIMALFAAVYMLYRDNTKKQDDINKLHQSHTEMIVELNKSHRDEMERLNASHDSNVERVTSILTTQIKESNEVGRQDRLNATSAFNKMGDVVGGLQLAIRELTTIVQQIDRNSH